MTEWNGPPEQPPDFAPSMSPWDGCRVTAPAFGWEGEGADCMRPVHEDPWHYWADKYWSDGEDRQTEMWWRSSSD